MDFARIFAVHQSSELTSAADWRRYMPRKQRFDIADVVTAPAAHLFSRFYPEQLALWLKSLGLLKVA
jgi:hypothetical protein